MDGIGRRQLIVSGALAAGALAGSPRLLRAALAAPARAGVSPYGPLGPPDANGLMLQPGFGSREIARGLSDVAGYRGPCSPTGRRPTPAPTAAGSSSRTRSRCQLRPVGHAHVLHVAAGASAELEHARAGRRLRDQRPVPAAARRGGGQPVRPAADFARRRAPDGTTDRPRTVRLARRRLIGTGKAERRRMRLPERARRRLRRHRGPLAARLLVVAVMPNGRRLSPVRRLRVSR